MVERNAILEAAKQRRQKRTKQLEGVLAAATARGATSLTEAEARSFEKLAAQIKQDDAQIKTLKREAKRLANAARAAASMTSPGVGGRRGAFHISGGETYSADLRESFFKDMATVAASTKGWTGQSDPDAARARLQQHRKEVEIESRSNPEIERALTELRMTPRSLESRVNPNTTAGTGGEFAPPLWSMANYAPFARPGREIANRIPTQALPPGIDVINIPRIKSGSTTAVQSANAQPVSSTDIQTSTVSAPVITIAGQQDFSMQLLEQSPLSMDGVIFEDLMSDYDQRLDIQIISGTGVSGQHLGALAQTAAAANTATAFNTDAAKMNAITCASAIFWDAASSTTTSFTQYRSIVNAATNIDTLRYRPATAIWAHPRRIATWSFASDGTVGRPLFTKYGPYNALGSPNELVAQGVAGDLYGLPVVKDANMPTTCSTGSITSGTGDAVALVRESDMILYEGTVRLRMLPEILSGTLALRAQLYCYSAFVPHRFPASTSLITGSTGLAAASF